MQTLAILKACHCPWLKYPPFHLMNKPFKNVGAFDDFVTSERVLAPTPQEESKRGGKTDSKEQAY